MADTMKEICPHSDCTACFACYNSCHSNAIVITKDALGFDYPLIDESKCVECGSCYSSCPALKRFDGKFPFKCYAVQDKDEESLMKCASGGVATILAKEFIKNGGVVYGASSRDMTNVCHERFANMDSLRYFRGSKYVQSFIGPVLSSVLGDLRNGLKVLFAGTPCQVDGLRHFLRKDYPKLLTIDLVCHGVPSRQLLNDNIALYRAKYSDINPNTVKFRQKVTDAKGNVNVSYGWVFNRGEEGEKISVPEHKDLYMFGFTTALFYRESCYSCRYSYSSRVGDLTICDFWGLGPIKDINTGKGVSAVLVNTDKGAEYIPYLSDSSIIIERAPQEAIAGNGNLQRPSAQNPGRPLFLRLYPKAGWEKAAKAALKHSRKKRLILKTLNIIRKIINV